MGADGGTYKSSHGAVESMSVVASELGVGTLERRVSVGLGLLDTVVVVGSADAFVHSFIHRSIHPSIVWRSASVVVWGEWWSWRSVPVLVSLLALVVLGRVL